MCRTKVHQVVEDVPMMTKFPEAGSINDLSTEHWSGSDEGTYEQQVYCHQPYAPMDVLVQPTVHAVPERRPREMKPWPLIPTEWVPYCNELESCPEGFKMNVYDGRLTSFFEVPSDWIIPTHGAVRYIEHYNECGPYSRFRFQLCHNFINGRCSKGFDCTYIHSKQLPGRQEIHVLGVDAYERLPAGVALFIHTPGTSKKPQMIQSELIIRTSGSERLFTDVVEGNKRSLQRPQHCAHFQFKKVCNRGADCGFIHSLIPVPLNQQS